MQNIFVAYLAALNISTLPFLLSQLARAKGKAAPESRAAAAASPAAAATPSRERRRTRGRSACSAQLRTAVSISHTHTHTQHVGSSSSSSSLASAQRRRCRQRSADCDVGNNICLVLSHKMAACVVVFFTHTRTQLNAALAAPKSRQAFYTHTHAYCEQLKHIKQLCEHILTRFYFAKFFRIALLASLSTLPSLPTAAGSKQRGLTLAATASTTASTATATATPT